MILLQRIELLIYGIKFLTFYDELIIFSLALSLLKVKLLL